MKFSLAGIREQSFLILGTGVEDFWQEHETFSIILWRYGNIKISFGVQAILLEKSLDEVIGQKNERQVKRHLEMMRYSTSMKTAWPSKTWYVSICLCFLHKDFWIGY